jgi:hypothetical protein
MSGYMIVFGDCFGCGRAFGFNPNFVPSIRVNAKREPDPAGSKEPICGACMARANAKRVEMGEAPHPIHPEAYAPESA